MRKILFRGKCQETNEWLYGSLVTFDDGTCVMSFKEEDDKRFSSPVIPESVGQFIGFQDKNGIDIFEGDVVQSKFNSPKQVSIDFIGIYPFHFGDPNNGTYLPADCEVIGNIHEQGHLLK